MKRKSVFVVFVVFLLGIGAASVRWRESGSSYGSWRLSDFIEGEKAAGRTEKLESCLLEGTDLQIRVTGLRGRRGGGSVYIVAGIHGDEKAGWIAAELLREAELKAGTVTIVSPANAYGAEQNQRKTAQDRDLNRNFPGDPQGCDAERIAAAIYSDIQEKQPDLVLDLHEAHPGTESRDSLGNSIICQSLEQIGEPVLELLTASQLGEAGSEPLTLYGSPPPGSINRIVTNELGIPVITIETFREEELKTRVGNHLEIIEFLLKYYGLR